jgi:hypothetical protein
VGRTRWHRTTLRVGGGPDTRVAGVRRGRNPRGHRGGARRRRPAAPAGRGGVALPRRDRPAREPSHRAAAAGRHERRSSSPGTQRRPPRSRYAVHARSRSSPTSSTP